MRFRVYNQTRQKLLAAEVAEANRFLPRLIGLMGRRELRVGDGLHLRPCNGIHTFFMRIPIDAAFLDASLQVVKLFPALPPWRVTGVYREVRSVLELPAGVLTASDTQLGDQLVFAPTAR